MRALVCAALLAFFSLTATAPIRADESEPDQYEKVRERGVLEVAVYSNFPPFSYERDGQYVGLDVDIAAALAKSIGLPMKIRAVNDGEDSDDDLRNFLWKGSVLGGGTVDLMMHIGADQVYVSRQKQAAIFGIYLHEAVAVALHMNRAKNFSSIDQLKGLKAAVELGSISDLYLRNALNGALQESAVRYPTATKAVDAFVKDEVDAVLAPRGEMQGLLKLNGGGIGIEPKLIAFTGQFRSAWDIGMAVKATAPGLRTALQAALIKIENSGELASIYARYGLDYTRPQQAAAGTGTSQ